MATKRPEHLGPPELHYNSSEAQKYTNNSHIIEIQSKLSERAVELLALPTDHSCFILDLGCGSGLSGETLDESGHFWVGVDISESMLGEISRVHITERFCHVPVEEVAVERETGGDLILGDMGVGLPFRPGSFDGAMSISAIQWLCHANTSAQQPAKRLFRLFTSLYASLSRGSRAVFQFYPENSAQIELITQQAMKAGFTGGLVVDYPNSSKAKKIYLVLFVGGAQQLPKGLETQAESRQSQVAYSDQRSRAKAIRGKPPKKSRDWIQEKKERARRQGKQVREDSKFTGRRRKEAF